METASPGAIAQSSGLPLAQMYDPFGEGVLEEPYAHYAAWLRRGPVHRGVAPDSSDGECWYVLGYAAAKCALQDDRLGLEYQRVVPAEYWPPTPPELRPFFSLIQQWMIFRDPPDHTRLRRLLAPAFVRGALKDHVPSIRAFAQELLNQARERHSGCIDAIAELAFPLPVMVIGRLLGIESSDLKLLKSWSRALLGGIDLKRAGDQETAYAQAAQAAQDIGLYLKDLLTRRRAAPRADLMSRLAATDDVSDEELIANCALLLFAGHETTVNLIGNGLLALLRHPRELRRLREERALLPTAVEELLRYDSPAQMTFRFAMQPMELAGRSLQTGEPVGIVIGAANRDPSEFPDPQALNLGRSPNRHLSFGNARHACLGATLARLEGQIAFETWLDLCPHARLTDEPQQWLPSRGLRGLARLQIELA